MQAKRRLIDARVGDEVRHILVEIADRQIAIPAVIPFRRQIDVLRFVRQKRGIALRARATADAEQVIKREAALHARVIGAGDRMAV